MKMVVYDKATEQVNSSNYLGHTISIFENKDLKTKLSKLNHICGMIRRVLNKNIRKETEFYKTLGYPNINIQL
jgi:hypothetical protein